MDNQQQVAQLNDNFLEQLGLGALTPEAKESLLDYMREELQLRVGLALAENLSEQQINEFERLMAQGANQQTAGEWLSQNCPNYQEVVKNETELIRAELAQNRESILSGAPFESEADDV